jgi:signal transduction histidine kinase/CheY-like chemotaxis protein
VHPVYVFDVDGHCMWWSNQSNLELWGAVSLEEFVSRDFSADSDTIRRRIERSWEKSPGTGVLTDSATIYPKDVPQQVLLHHTAIYIGHDRRRGLLAQIERVAELATDNESLWLLAASRYTSTSVSLFEMSGELICQNPAAWEVYGDACAEGEMEFVHRFADSTEGQERLTVSQRRHESSAEHIMNTKLGARQHLVSVRMTRDPVSGSFALVVTEDDVTDLRALVTKAEAANYAKTNFLANMSHELRTPLTGILGFCEVLLLEELDAKQQRWLRLIQSAGFGLREILDDLLDLSQITSGQFGLNPKPFSLKSLCRSISQYWAPICASKGLLFKADLPEGDTGLDGDPLRIRQVFFNLLNNAVKFTAEGTIGLSVQLCEAEPGKVRLVAEVWDTGVGISDADKERVFGRFERVDLGATQRGRGVGLGLSICQEIVLLMEGQISCESEFGEGTRFRFHLNIGRAQSTAGDGSAGSRGADGRAFLPSQDLRMKRVLVVDDHASNRELLEAFLQSTGAECTLADDGQQAVDAVTETAFDVILMDSQMPAMTGEEALLKIRALDGPAARTPVVVLTAHAMDGDRERFLKMGFDGYVGKPIRRAELFAVLLALQEG